MGSYVQTPWKESTYINYLEFSLWEIFLFSLFRYLNTSLYQYGLLGIYFTHWIKIQYHFCCSNCSNFSLWELFQNGPQAFDMPSSLCFWVLPYFLVLHLKWCSKLILNNPFPALESAISPKSCGSFHMTFMLNAQQKWLGWRIEWA